MAKIIFVEDNYKCSNCLGLINKSEQGVFPLSCSHCNVELEQQEDSNSTTEIDDNENFLKKLSSIKIGSNHPLEYVFLILILIPIIFILPLVFLLDGQINLGTIFHPFHVAYMAINIIFLLYFGSSQEVRVKYKMYIIGLGIFCALVIGLPLLQNFNFSLNSNSNSSSNTYYCNWCGDDYSGRGFTTAMYVVNQVDDESNPLNSYCSRKCAIDWIRSKGREPLRVN